VVTLPAQPVDERGTDKAPLAVHITEMPQRPPDDIERERAEVREKTSTDHWTIGLTLATAVILAFQLVVFGVQARRLNESIKEAKRATEATQTAAKAAEQTVTTMNLTARRDLRAYVFVLKGSVDRLDENGNPRATVTIKNSGKTPAYAFAVSADIAFVAPNTEPPAPREPGHPLGHLAPSGEFEVILNANWTLTGPMRLQVTTRTGSVVVCGLIKYVDTYGEPHFTRFRVVTDGQESVPNGRLVSFPAGNETDDDERIAVAASPPSV